MMKGFARRKPQGWSSGDSISNSGVPGTAYLTPRIERRSSGDTILNSAGCAWFPGTPGAMGAPADVPALNGTRVSWKGGRPA